MQRPPRDLTKEMFPTLAVENQTQNKLFKLANAISGYEYEEDNEEKQRELERKEELRRRLQILKDEHFNDSQGDNFYEAEVLMTTEDELEDL